MNRLWLILGFICIATAAVAQVEEDEQITDVDAIIDELILDESSVLDYIEEFNKYHIIFVSADYNNKTYFLGRDLGIGQFTFSPQALYQHHSGVYLGVSGAIYSEFDPKWDITTASLGYSKNFGKHDNFNVDISYSRYFFSNSESRDFENSLDASVSIETKNSLLGASAGINYFFGDKQGVQNNFDIYSTINLFKLAKKHLLSFNPRVTFILGNESIDTSRLTDFQLGSPIVNLILNEFETYALRNTQLSLPLNFDLNDFGLEVGYIFNFPNALTFERNLENSSYLSFGVSYIFSFK